MEILSFFTGIVFTYTREWVVLLCLLVACWFAQNIRHLLWCMVGAIWACVHEYESFPNALPQRMVLKNIHLQGVISSIPKVGTGKTQFQFEVHQYQDKPMQTLIWMSCYQACPPMKVGEAWSGSVTLKKPKLNVLPGEMNPHYWLMSNHIEWLGVLDGRSAVRLHTPQGIWRFQSFRERLAESLTTHLKHDHTLGLLQGLTLGVASHIEKSQWDLFRRTGTTHLVVISGEHIGLIAGFTFMCAQWIWTRIPRLALYIPAQQAASVLAWSVGCFYAFLCGLGAPVERAIIGFGVLLLRYFIAQRFTVWQAWRYALFIILLIEPHVVVTPGFYLSFIAVAILVLMSARFPAKRFRLAVQLQLACLIGLTPLTLYAFSYASLNGFIVNLIAIPLVGLIIVPTALIGLILIQVHPWDGWLWMPKQGANLFLTLLSYLDRFEWMNLNVSIDDLLSVMSIMLGLFLSTLLPIRGLYLMYACLLILPFYQRQTDIQHEQAKVTVFDVGQGLAVLIQTAQHSILYDTGGVFYQGGDWASFKVLPYLRHLKLKKLDGLVISHPDLDHRGGLSSIEKELAVARLWVNEPAFYHRGEACHDQRSWVWDGVAFRFFALPTQLEKRNNTSCILQVKTKTSSLLLTGDIEFQAEAYLVTRYGMALQSNYIVVPHHGSQTSSSMPFLMMVHPHLGIISSGLNNRYHFPHKKALQRYEQLKIPLKNTAELGAIQYDF